MKQIIVKINGNPRKYTKGYQDGDPLEAALTVEVYNAGLTSPDDSDDSLCEAMFSALNVDGFFPVGNLTHQQVLDYHKKFPSLSVGDVVEINGLPYACTSAGWRELPRPEHEWVWKDAADVAKIVRSILKEAFPETKFSVRTSKYAGGASINVDWWDGPRQSDVDRLIKHLQAVSHMDITDYVHHKKSVWNGVPFHSGAHYIFTKRHFSKGYYAEIAAKVCREWGINPVPNIVESSFGSHFSGDAGHRNMSGNGSYFSLDDLVRKTASEYPSASFRYEDEPDSFDWTDSEGNQVSSTYFHGKVKSRWSGGTRTEYVTSDDWVAFKAEQGAKVLAHGS